MSVRGRFLWMELLAQDPGAALRFYPAVCGWQTAEFRAEGMPPYTMWVANGDPLGGILPRPEETPGPSTWLAYVGVDDVEATAEQAVRLGGSIWVAPRRIPTVGVMAVLADPWGATFALYCPESGMPPPLEPPRVGEFSWHELATDDVDGALRFYGELFGWRESESHDMGDLGTYHLFGSGAWPLGGVYRRPQHVPVCVWLSYVRVTDLEGAVDVARNEGAEILHGPVEVPGGDRIAIATDPQGAHFALHEVAPR